MKRKFFSVLLALVLVLSFSLVTATPAAASPGTLNVYPFTLSAGTNAAAWSTVQEATGSSSVKLNYVSGDNSSYVEFTPATGTTVNDLATITSTQWSFWYYASAANGPLLELRFTSGSGHVDITVNTAESSPAIDTGTTEAVTTASTCIYFGNDTVDQTSFYNNTGSVTLAGVLASIDAQSAMTAHTESAATWELTRVRVEIGWDGSARNCYIDDIEINNVTYYGKIQDAIDSATAADTISVAAGTYTEDLTIGTAVTLESVAGAATTTILTAGSPNDIVLVTAASVTIDGFTIQGLGVASGAVNGIDVRNSGFTIKNNVFVDIYYDNIFLGNTAVAITSGLADNNTFTGMGTSAAAYRPAINVESNANAISGVTISNNTISDYGGVESAGIQVAETTGAVSAIVVSGNTISDSSFGIATWNNFAATFTDNTITGCDVGVDIYGDETTINAAFTLSESTITGNTDYGIRLRGPGSDTLVAGNMSIKYSDITGNGDGILVDFDTVSSNPVAKYNYWGDPSGPTVTTNARGAGDTVTVTDVTYEPWLHTTQATVYPSGVRYYAYNWCDLTKGWNIWSTPIALDAQADTWKEYRELGNDLDLASGSNVYYFTSSGLWASPGDDYSLTPCDALYIKMASDNTSPILFSASTSVPSKTLVAGWNLVSASYINDMTTPVINTGQNPQTVLASVYNVAGANNLGYSQVVSPAVNQTAWSGVRGTAINSTVGEQVSGTDTGMLPCKGYWVYMTNAGTLAGTVFTPVSPLQ